MAINLDEWMGWISTIQLTRRFEQLPKLYLFHRTNASETSDFKMGTIARTLKMNERMHRKTHPDYIAPLVFKPTVPIRAIPGWDGDMQDWYMYKYPKGTYTHVRSNRSAKVRNRDLSTSLRTTKRTSTQMVEETRVKMLLRGKSSTQRSSDRSHRDVVVPDLAHSMLFPEKPLTRNTLKRKRQDDEVVSTIRVPRKAARLSCPKERPTPTPSRVVIDLVSPPRSPVCRPLVQSRDSSRISGQHSFSQKEPTFWVPELLSPTPEVLLSPSLEANTQFRSPLDGMTDADLALSVARTSSPFVSRLASPAYIDHPAAFKTSFNDGDEAEITAGEEENVRTACHDLQNTISHEKDEQFKDGLQGGRDHPGDTGTICRTPNRPVIEEDHFIDSGYAEDIGMKPDLDKMPIEDYTRRAIFPPPCGPGLGELENDDTFPPSKQLISELEVCSTLEDSNTEEEYEPVKIIAERKTEEGITQFLVQWLGWPEEKDWTWEDEKTLLDLPIITIWKEAQEKEKESVNIVYIVEKILGKRKFKGVPHYLVSWKGFSEVGDRTWEPCGRLEADVPGIVDGFEGKRRRGRK